MKHDLDKKSRVIDKQNSQLETLNREIPLPSERHLQDQEEIEELKIGIVEFQEEASNIQNELIDKIH